MTAWHEAHLRARDKTTSSGVKLGVHNLLSLPPSAPQCSVPLPRRQNILIPKKFNCGKIQLLGLSGITSITVAERNVLEIHNLLLFCLPNKIAVIRKE